jgi:hypothetical protein
MRFNYDEIKKCIEDEWEMLSIDPFPEDRLTEMADGFVPIYYGDIIKDWQEMDHEYTDNWKEQYGGVIPEEVGITALMTSDLAEYYRDTTLEIYGEIKDEKEDN